MQIGEGMVSNTYLQNGIVSKQYFTPFHKYAPRNIKWHWKAEIKALEKLKGKKHFPQLINIDHANRIIYMSYCGEALTPKTLPKNWEKQCADIEETLYGSDIYHQDLKGSHSNPNPPHNKNIHILDGVINIIDFGIWAKDPSKHRETITDMVTKISKESWG